ncbi:MAG: hypothetical protein AB7V62_00915 [Thermoleophilia bacterium]
MSAADRDAGGGLVGRIARSIVAPVISGATAAIVFLVMIQGSFHKGYTDLDFNHVLGTLIEGDADEVGSTQEALGVVGDSVGPTGLWATIVGGIILMAIHEFVITRFVRRRWLIQAIPLSVLTIFAVGVVFAGIADARFDTPVGWFGMDSGGISVIVVLLSSIGFALVGARIHDLASRAWWWETRPDPLAEETLEDLAGIETPD